MRELTGLSRIRFQRPNLGQGLPTLHVRRCSRVGRPGQFGLTLKPWPNLPYLNRDERALPLQTGGLTCEHASGEDDLFDKAGFERQGHAVDFAVDLVVTVDQADVFGLAALFQNLGRAAQF